MVITLVDTYEVNRFIFLFNNSADRLYKNLKALFFQSFNFRQILRRIKVFKALCKCNCQLPFTCALVYRCCRCCLLCVKIRLYFLHVALAITLEKEKWKFHIVMHDHELSYCCKWFSMCLHLLQLKFSSEKENVQEGMCGKIGSRVFPCLSSSSSLLSLFVVCMKYKKTVSDILPIKLSFFTF